MIYKRLSARISELEACSCGPPANPKGMGAAYKAKKPGYDITETMALP